MGERTRDGRSLQVRWLRRQFAQGSGLPFSEVLSAELVERVSREVGGFFRERLFTPLTTLWVLLSQGTRPDGSCRHAVMRRVALLSSRGEKPCSPSTGSYGKARKRLPENVLLRLTQETAARMTEEAPADWRWKGREVKVVDGTTLWMPDTPANQKAYPQSRGQKPGLGFPLVRLVCVFSLATGAVVDAGLGPCRGDRQSARRRPAQPFRAKGSQTASQTVPVPYDTTKPIQKRLAENDFGLRKRHSIQHVRAEPRPKMPLDVRRQRGRPAGAFRHEVAQPPVPDSMGLDLQVLDHKVLVAVLLRPLGQPFQREGDGFMDRQLVGLLAFGRTGPLAATLLLVRRIGMRSIQRARPDPRPTRQPFQPVDLVPQSPVLRLQRLDHPQPMIDQRRPLFRRHLDARNPDRLGSIHTLQETPKPPSD